MGRDGRAAVAGAVAAAIWQLGEPLLQRAFQTPYSDVRVASAFVDPSGRHEPWAGLAIHSSIGAAFGVAFSRLGGRGWKQGAVAGELENLGFWPAMAIVDRVHPDRRNGTWPPLLWNGRVFAQASTAHVLFGALLGGLLEVMDVSRAG